LPQTQPEKTIEIAERLRRTVKSIAIPVADNKNISLTISIGIGQYSDQNQSLHEVLSLADKALYQAKEQGRNRVVLFEE
jgi:diguanylate cyclase (GGDEF)-like protein